MADDKKRREVECCLAQVQKMLHYLNDRKNWYICYKTLSKKDIESSSWTAERFYLIPGDECFMIYEKNELLYCVNVTGDNTLTAIEELIALLSKKF